MMIWRIGAVLLSLWAHCAIAADGGVAYLTPYVGAYDIKHDRKFMGGLEGRFNNVHNYIVPKIGGFITGGAASYVYAGVNFDLPIYRQLYLIPGFAVGAYNKHKGKNLGGVLEFRSSIELNYKFANAHRVGLALAHISNAGIYKKNPGEEDVLITYSIPLKF